MMEMRSPEELMTFAEEGHLPKRTLASLLKPEYWEPFLEACANIEKQYTDNCAAEWMNIFRNPIARSDW